MRASSPVPCVLILIAWTRALTAQGYSPDEALRRMKVPAGFEVGLVAAEPMVRQPVAIEFDDRGRLWVVQYLQYPNPAGLKRVKVDRYSRTAYDHIPEPPPRGPRGADRITILEDDDGDGRADRAHDFLDGLNLASGIAFGQGGVFVIQAPYLLFYPDRDRDDRPDSDPEVVLEGFGMEDASSVANSLTWGPDGWLYGAQGSTVTAHVRGLEFQQGVWRWHPRTKAFELFYEGGGNTWGLDFDETGNLFASTNVGGYVMLHGMQGGYYWKQFEKHGALHNPYAYGYLEHVKYTGYRGGHVTAGGVIYDGASFPGSFRGTYIAADTLTHAVNWHNLSRVARASTFEASFGGALLETDDTWFAPDDVTIGPDGAVYVADWYDKRTAHPDPDAEWDRSNGRIYRVAAKGTRPASGIDLPQLSSQALVNLLESPSGWHRERARRILAERGDAAVIPALRQMAADLAERHRNIEGLWALHACGGLDDATAGQLLEKCSEEIGVWILRFFGDEHELPPTIQHMLCDALMRRDSPGLRAQFAVTARRLRGIAGLNLAKWAWNTDRIVDDPQLSLLLWWAIEDKVIPLREQVLEMFARDAADRLVRRYAAEGTRDGLEACARLLQAASWPNGVRARIGDFLAGLEGPKRWEDVPESLRVQILSSWSWSKGADEVIFRALLRVGWPEGRERALSLVRDASAPAALRLAAVEGLRDIATPETVPILAQVLASDAPEDIRAAAIDSLASARGEEDAAWSALSSAYSGLSDRLRLRIRAAAWSRMAWTLAFLRLVNAGKIAPRDVPVEEARRAAVHAEPEIDALVRKHWGVLQAATPEEKLAEVRRLNNDLRAAKGDVVRGRPIFARLCGACHKLGGEGKAVGPDLTTANRKDRDFLLVSIVDPGAMVRKEYLSYVLRMKDGRVLTGLVAKQDGSSLDVVNSQGEHMTIARGEVEAIDESPGSIMPEGLLAKLAPEELRDLFACLEGR